MDTVMKNQDVSGYTYHALAACVCVCYTGVCVFMWDLDSGFCFSEHFVNIL